MENANKRLSNSSSEMEGPSKRFKYADDTVIEDIANYISGIATSIKTIGKTHEALLYINKAMVMYMHKSKVDTSKTEPKPSTSKQ